MSNRSLKFIFTVKKINTYGVLRTELLLALLEGVALDCTPYDIVSL